MWAWFGNGIIELKNSGVPVEILIGIIGIFLSALMVLSVVKMFKKKHDKLHNLITSGLRKLHEVVDANKSSLETSIVRQTNVTTNLTETQIQLISQFNVAIELLSSQINGDESITEGQAVIVYSTLIDEARHEMENLYYKLKKWSHNKNLIENSAQAAQLKDRIDNTFEALEADIIDKLRQFKFQGKYLDKFHSKKHIKSEWTHITVHFYSTLYEGSNGLVEYSNAKAEKLKSQFNLWLRESS
tara:strand:- start:10535 stop:11263 length:729 start_codon:yes stop_codon:yes gene_type:complete